MQRKVGSWRSPRGMAPSGEALDSPADLQGGQKEGYCFTQAHSAPYRHALSLEGLKHIRKYLVCFSPGFSEAIGGLVAVS